MWVRSVVLVLISLLAAATLSGCTTAQSLFLEDDEKIYGGTRLSLRQIHKEWNPETEGTRHIPVAVFYTIFAVLIEIPLGVVFDTLLLPVTIPMDLNREEEPESNGDSLEVPQDGQSNSLAPYRVY